MKTAKRYAVLSAVGIFVVLLASYSFFIEPNMIFTNIVTIENDNLFALFHDKKVVQISDLHITSIGYREQQLIKELNLINPDILFITGDLLTDGKDEDSCLEVLQRIKRPPYGIWVVMGNTDRYGRNGLNEGIDGFIKKLQNLGIRVLENECEQLFLNNNGDHIFIAGIEGIYLSRSKINWLLRDIPNNSPVILLSHYPDIIEEHADALVINLEEEEDAGVSGWGGQDNAFFEYDSGIVRFTKDGEHTLRVQRREDGVAIEQICLVPANGNAPFNASVKNLFNDQKWMSAKTDAQHNELIIINAKDIHNSNIFGSWKKVEDLTADINPVIKDIPGSGVKNEFPLVDPEHYFEADFYTKGNVDYHVLVRMKAEDDLISNDSIYLQFNDSINKEGEPIYRIGEFAIRNKLKKIDLILAGHTHGGQIRFPVIGALDIVPGHRLKYDMGLFENQGTTMYVNRGIGTTLFPIRLFCSPEITIFRFTKDKGISREKGQKNTA